MNRTNQSQTSEARSGAPESCSVYLFTGLGAVAITPDAVEKRDFMVGQLIVFGFGVFGLVVAAFIQMLFRAAY
jgi:hypothetical protein